MTTVNIINITYKDRIPMALPPKKKVLELPVKLILTQEGSTFFIKKNKKLLRFTMAGDFEEYGISFDSFTAPTIQRLIFAEYISKIEVSGSELISSRSEIMDLSKMIIYSFLYRQYNSFIYKQILNSSVIQKWNRANPSSIIDEKTHINENYLAKVLNSNQAIIDATKKEILTPLHSFINNNEKLQPEEKNIQCFLSEKFLKNLRPFIWFIITKFKDVPGFDGIIKIIRTSLTEYMDKTYIAEYISLMLMELVLSAHNINMRKEASLIFPELTDPQEALLDPKIREQLLSEIKQKGKEVFISWKIGGISTTSIGTQGKLSIAVYNKGDSSEVVRAHMNNIKNKDINKKSLIDFYKNIPEGSDPSNLGMYYLSYLNEACQKVNVRFESSANQFTPDITVINLGFVF